MWLPKKPATPVIKTFCMKQPRSFEPAKDVEGLLQCRRDTFTALEPQEKQETYRAASASTFLITCFCSALLKAYVGNVINDAPNFSAFGSETFVNFR